MDVRRPALEIAQELGGLPLALDQAGVYIKATRSSLATYQQIYRQHHVQLLKERRGVEHPEPVATTWNISFRKVEQQNSAAADLLRLCAFLAPDAIPESIITEGAPYLGPKIALIGTDPYLLNQAIEVLPTYSLLYRETSNSTISQISIHRLVQVVLRDQMDKQSRLQWAKRVVRAVNEAFPLVEHDTWPQCDLLLPHASLCVIWIEQEQMIFPGTARLLNQTGSYLRQRARYTEAEPLFLRALTIYEQQLGPEHPSTATSLQPSEPPPSPGEVYRSRSIIFASSFDTKAKVGN